MEYESDRTLIEAKLEEAKRLALKEAGESTFVCEAPDPNWAQPAPQPTLPAVGIEEAQGFWINGGKTGSKKDEPLPKPETFDHDLPSLLKDGPTTLPKGEWAEPKLAPAEIEERMKARDVPVAELSVDEFNKGVNIGPNSEPVYRRVFPMDNKV